MIKKESFEPFIDPLRAEEFVQFNEKLDHFEFSYETTLMNSSSSFILLLVCFNAKSLTWCDNDTTSNKGSIFESLTYFNSLSQLIKDPTHIPPTSSSCIDLIFTDQTSIIRNSGVQSSFQTNCHHQMIFCQLNLKIYYPLP